MVNQRWFKTNLPGVRYRQHPTRKHGAQKDRYFAITYKLDGKTKTEAIGWASAGEKAVDCFILAQELRKNRKSGKGPRTLAEKRTLAEAIRMAESEVIMQAERDAITVKEFFNNGYLDAQTHKKPLSIARDIQLFGKWINPVIGTKTFGAVSTFDMEKIGSRMKKAGLAPRTIQYCYQVISQIFNTAKFQNLYDGESPTLHVKKPKFDNRRVRFLSDSEAEGLLTALKSRSTQTYQQAIISLYAGARFGEIAGLRWADVDTGSGVLTLLDTKNTKSRPAFITERIKTEVFDKITPGRRSELVFPGKHGKELGQVSSTFRRTVKDIGLNAGVTDRRQRVCFHSLRHTFASRLVERGIDIFQVSKLLGHSSIALTERYSHLRPDTLQAAVKVLDRPVVAQVVDIAEAVE